MAEYQARTTFFWGQRVINQGDVVKAGDPVLVHAPALFEAIGSLVEQATAAPGERRSVRIPRKKES